MTNDTDADDPEDDMEWANEDEEDLGWAEDGTDEGEADGEAFPAPDEDGTGPAAAPEESLPEGEQPPVADDETFEEMEGAFDDAAVDEVEADEVWEDVTDEEESEAPLPEEQSSPEELEGDIAEVSKHDYCESCEYFSQAPEIHCSHEGTEILDFSDMETVRVSNCPIVAERKGLEQGVSKGGTDLGEIQRD